MPSFALGGWGGGFTTGASGGFVRIFLSEGEEQRVVLSGFSGESIDMSSAGARSRMSLHTPASLHAGLLTVRGEPHARPSSARSPERCQILTHLVYTKGQYIWKNTKGKHIGKSTKGKCRGEALRENT